MSKHPTKMERTEELTRAFRHHIDTLTDRVESYEEEVAKIRRRRMAGIKLAVRAAAGAREELRRHIEANQKLFKKPRTVIIAGLRVGMQKGKGKIEFDDNDKVVRLIRKHLPDQAETLVKITEAPVKKALSNLSAAELKRIGCTVKETDDQVVIKPVDGDVEKLVSAMLKEAEDMEREAA